MKDVLRCNADTVSTQALQICNKTSMDPKNCHFWLTDNTIYMASKTVHIALMNFENAAFEKINAIKGLSLKEYPYNILNLAFYLHDDYNLSNKDNPLNLKASNYMHETENFISSDDFNNLCKSLQTGVKKALDGFIKWMGV
ncbi:hypothetical protein RhiirA1_473280 [Rhizophagus irregularis]|uniref:Uncharacterized protein n=1 Tax=Rhizophagus irregularis TaxID=588596 RepID=A0A2I1FC19_9GLOM|nr:hypothetical protein RhiirA1_473280 [Rhizophagus irregularis]PKY31920.1 hypothetical protein RhiirB3_449757 [Rhizophagus irregularis]